MCALLHVAGTTPPSKSPNLLPPPNFQEIRSQEFQFHLFVNFQFFSLSFWHTRFKAFQLFPTRTRQLQVGGQGQGLVSVADKGIATSNKGSAISNNWASLLVTISFFSLYFFISDGSVVLKDTGVRAARC